jgi:hypothetical protein
MSDSTTHLSLSTKGLQRLKGTNHERDFTFIVGDERYDCPSFVADFLSPRITSLRSHDITITEFSIETADPNHLFGTLLSLGFGGEISMGKEGLNFVRSVSSELWNSELFWHTVNHPEGEITEEELKARLDFLSGFDFGFDFWWGFGFNWESEIRIIASHFYAFSICDFDKLSQSVLQAILSESTLVLEDEDSVFDIIHRRASDDLTYFGLLENVRFEFLSTDCMKRALEFISNSFDSFTFGIWKSLRIRLELSVTAPCEIGRFVLPEIDSKIISRLPKVFTVFRHKTFRLLYRGSRDGFQATAFHSRCDGHRNTVSFIISKNDSIFGGYTPLAWSSSGGWASDASLQSFVFTIKNPHNLPAQIFKQKKEEYAIYDVSTHGPTFGSNHDFRVFDPFESATRNYSDLGNTYTNDTGIGANKVLTGESSFGIKEIEVFEVI